MSHKFIQSTKKKRIRISAIAVLFLFGAVFFAGTVSAQVEAAPTYRLIGTIQGSPLRGAVFQDSSGKQTFLQLLEKLPDGSQIVKLFDDRISLKGADGTMYDMFISRDTRSIASATPPIRVNPSVQQNAASEPRTENLRDRRTRHRRYSSSEE